MERQGFQGEDVISKMGNYFQGEKERGVGLDVFLRLIWVDSPWKVVLEICLWKRSFVEIGHTWEAWREEEG